MHWLAWDRRSRVVRILAVVAMLALVAGCSIPASPGPAPGPDPTTPPPTTPVAFVGDLRTLLLPLPPNATRTPSPDSTDGQMTLDQAAKVYSDPTVGAQQLRTI